MPFNLSMPEILVIGFLLIIFFGKDKLPEAARSIGKAVNSLKDEMNPNKLLGLDEDDEEYEEVEVKPRKKRTVKKTVKKASVKTTKKSSTKASTTKTAKKAVKKSTTKKATTKRKTARA